jgi:hypothetical protein
MIFKGEIIIDYSIMGLVWRLHLPSRVVSRIYTKLYDTIRYVYIYGTASEAVRQAIRQAILLFTVLPLNLNIIIKLNAIIVTNYL